MAYQITEEQFRDEWITVFQRGETYLKDAVTKETMTSGLSANFPVQGAAGRMTSRGANGLIPSRNRTDTQPKTTLVEKHSKETQTGFNIFTAPADVREAMQNAGALTAAREIDYTIIETLEQATNQFEGGAATTLDFADVRRIAADLLANDVNSADENCYVWTPAAWGRLLGMDEFTNADYVDTKKLMGMSAEKPVKWLGGTHMHHTGLPGMGTASATCFAFAKSAIGHACSNDMVQVAAGYNDEDDYSYSRHTIYDGAVILQNAGIIKITHDDTAAY